MIDYLVYLRGLFRVWFGFCPICNSDAPELDSCSFCGSFRGYRDKTARKDLRSKWVKHCGRGWREYWT